MTGKKGVLLLVALLALARTGTAQQLVGAWYCPTRGGLLEVAIDQLTIRGRLVTTDFRVIEESPPVFPVRRTLSFGSREMLLLQHTPDTVHFSALIAFDIVPGKAFRRAWNVPDTLRNTTLQLLAPYVATGGQLWGPRFYSARYLEKLQRLRPLESMTKQEFAQYFSAYTANYLRQAPVFDGQHYRYSLANYNFDMLTETLYEGGFNPLQTRATIEELFRRFAPSKKAFRKLQAMLES
ncbi:hypothetical protein Q5H93_03790 [Hymenobacter sp. ASUV-10]|uniref:DUF4369 domain-containing protein n=1 Tax=Hymenobacter aranciens TaxID=3063996 RepID=A0ABT9B6R3_9BACT|nr:hypothetical protein [Hymenobacter sp. ASUV-10]MDO7873842.1 hypothetical protein [Hymenobacter sp. ASUV-10]